MEIKITHVSTIPTSEVEWRAMVHGVHHAIFIRGIPGEMNFAEHRMSWFHDNRDTVQAASKARLRKRTKHVNNN